MRLTGHQAPFTLAPAAHRDLLTYLSEARAELTDDPDGDETVRDLEVSIGDHLDALGEHRVDRAQMRTVLDRVGPVVNDTEQVASAAPGSAATGQVSTEPTGPTWSRILEGKWLSVLLYLALSLLLPPVGSLEEYRRRSRPRGLAAP